MTMNKWREVWGRRDADSEILLHSGDKMAIWRELKRADGFDVSVGENKEDYYNSFYMMWKSNYDTIIGNSDKVETLFEVGCGAGASLYLYKDAGFDVKGVDYSEKCVEIANSVLGDKTVKCMEASEINTESKYDVVLSDSVFVYFPDEEYAMSVLRKMYDKARKLILITEIYDKDYEKECIEYRRSKIEDYDKRYEGLEKLFLNRSFFEDFAKDNNCRIEITKLENEFYWNSDYMYNALLVKEQ